jgi:hypothetical protein
MATTAPRRGLRIRHRWQVLATMLVTCLALIALLLVTRALVTATQQQLHTALYGDPLTIRLTADLGGALPSPTTAWAINQGGQVNVLVVSGPDLAQIRVLPGPYIPGREGRFVVPWLRAADADGDGDGDLVLNIAGELFVYLQGSDGVLHYATEAEQSLLRPADEIWP